MSNFHDRIVYIVNLGSIVNLAKESFSIAQHGQLPSIIVRVWKLAVVSGLTEERSCKPDRLITKWTEFIRCVTIKGLSLLDMIHNIDFMSCLTARPWPLNFVRRRWTVLYDWLCVCVLAVGPRVLNFVRRKTTVLDEWVIEPYHLLGVL